MGRRRLKWPQRHPAAGIETKTRFGGGAATPRGDEMRIWIPELIYLSRYRYTDVIKLAILAAKTPIRR
jgi:hypothetical protein